MTLDDRITRLIAVGASVAANCQPCLEHNLSKALENGADSQQIAEAIKIGKMVRQGAAGKMDEFLQNLNAAFVSSGVSDGGCGCSS
jgi:AhpD family alkylhydroperoxidase